MKPSLHRATTRVHPIPGHAMALALGLGLAIALTALAILANAALLAMAACAAPATERFVLSGDRLEICDLVGEVRIVRGNGPATEVLVTRGGRDAARLRIETADAERGGRDGRSWLGVIYPGRRIVYPRLGAFGHTSLSVGSDGCMGSHERFSFVPRRVTVASGGFGLQAWADLEVRVPAGRDLTLHLGVGEASVAGVEGKLLLDVSSASVRAEDTRGPLTVDTGSGGVEVRRCQGDLVVDTGSGEVEVEDARGGRILIDTGSGQVTGLRLAADVLSVDTGSGHVQVDAASAREIKIDTGSGGVHLGLEERSPSLVVDTGSGSVEIQGPPALDARVRLETSSGGIESDYPMTLLHRESDTLEGTIGQGRGSIRVDTGSGAVRLTRR